ncbi:MAG TPA: ABC transporter ATP-binding protein [Oceanipulchritudo sp.]|nr:ABC transporter ATP-binding protein [Oceanipulchritudo sp.]
MSDNFTGNGTLLSVESLRIWLGSPAQEVVRGISFSIAPGEVVGLAGESGSGKSITSLALTRLLPVSANPACTGTVHLRDLSDNLLGLPTRTLRRIRGHRIGYIFQEPSSSFNPVFTIGQQLDEVLRVGGMGAGQRPAAISRAMEEVGIEATRENLRSYPGAFSGGMLQRMAIACALAGEPDLLIADEPTTALDTTTQKRITELLQRLNRDKGMAILFISHNLGLLKSVANRLIVMRLGEIVEQGPTEEVLGNPQHAYTRTLIRAVPRLVATSR